MSDPRQHIEAQLEAQRHLASQASREQSRLDVVSVLYAIQVKLSEGRYEEAKVMYLNWKNGSK